MKHKLTQILLVEDEPEVQFQLKRFLERFCNTVITADNGEEGLALFKTHRPDIVISDIKMPKMNGIDMANEIKQISKDQVILFTTAHSDSDYFLKAIEMQVDGYILKPVDLHLLKNKLESVAKNIILQKQKQFYENILNDIAQMQESMLAVYDEQMLPIFYNKKLLSFLGYKTLQAFLKEHNALSDKFEKNEECYYLQNRNKYWLEELLSIDSEKRIISMKERDTVKSKMFFISISEKTENNHIVVSFSEITSIVDRKRQYLKDAHTDELTQIHNRTKFNIVFTQTLEKFQQEDISFSIILMDIDHFKKINDRYGHLIGDTILKKFATLIQKNIADKNSLSRWGGEEFVLLLPNCNINDAKDIAEKLRLLIETYDFGVEKKLTCSFGVAKVNKGDSTKSLFQRVDNALYKAKNSGRNSVFVSYEND